MRDYPPPPIAMTTPGLFEPGRVKELQLQRLRDLLHRAWETDFYRRRWQEIDFHPADLRSLDDLRLLPPYTVDDLRNSLDRNPPWGEHHRIDPLRHGHLMPLRAYFSGGTTGKARPVVYTPRDRALVSLMQARTHYLQGVRPGDIVINAWQYGLHQGAWVIDEAAHRWIGAMPLTASTGNVTSSEKQLLFARDYKASTVLTTSDYLIHLARVAEKLGYDLQEDFSFRHFPTAAAGDTGPVERVWGRPAYDCYGTYELSSLAAECEAKDGLHIWDDGYIVEVVHPQTGEPVAEGESGNLVVTSLYLEAFPVVRYNTLDVSRLLGYQECACGLATTKMDPFQSRSDTMIKLRGINVWPEAIGKIVTGFEGVTGEYFCVVERVDERDQMTVKVETVDAAAGESLRAAIEDALKSQLGVRIEVEPVGADSLDSLTGKGRVGKLRRLADVRSGQALRPD